MRSLRAPFVVTAFMRSVCRAPQADKRQSLQNYPTRAHSWVPPLSKPSQRILPCQHLHPRLPVCFYPFAITRPRPFRGIRHISVLDWVVDNVMQARPEMPLRPYLAIAEPEPDLSSRGVV